MMMMMMMTSKDWGRKNVWNYFSSSLPSWQLIPVVYHICVFITFSI